MDYALPRDGFSTRKGFTATHLTTKGLLCENDPRETLISGSFAAAIGGLGGKGVGSGGPYTLQTSVTFGKGFGDLSDRLKWLRPFAIAEATAPEFPINRRTKTLLFDPSSDQSRYGYVHNPVIVQWAFSLEFSTLYLTSRFIGGNNQGGNGVGVTAGLEFFLGDLAPSLFAKPLLEP